jgi:putative oxidoreductase
MLMRLLSTGNGMGMLWARIPLGIIMVQHGYGKFMAPSGFIAFCDNLGIPPFFAICGACGEFLGGLGLLLGGLTRIAAFGVACSMAVAAITRHLLPGYGFVMNYHGTNAFATEGYEFHVVAVGISVGLMFVGAGSVSLDHVLSRMLAKRRAQTAPALEGSPVLGD